jgi:hypothetical protein
MTKRKRSARLCIAGDLVALNAPGLKQIKRNAGIDVYPKSHLSL